MTGTEALFWFLAWKRAPHFVTDRQRYRTVFTDCECVEPDCELDHQLRPSDSAGTVKRRCEHPFDIDGCPECDMFFGRSE